MASNYRNLARFLVPSWLYSGDGEKVIHSLMLIVDAFAERARLGLEARFPSRAGASALKLIGDDRGFIRGRAETAEHYAARLQSWRYPRGHRVRGSAFAALEQVSEYFGGVLCWTIDVKGNRHERTAAGVEAFEYDYVWDWDGEVAPLRRFWVVIDLIPQYDLTSETQAIEDDEDGPIGEGAPECIGMDGIVPDDAVAIRRLFVGRGAWKPAGTRAEFAIFSLAENDPPEPDGTWHTAAGRQGSGFRFVGLR